MDRPDRFPIGDPNRQEIPVLISTVHRAMAGYIDMRNFDGAGRFVLHVRELRNARKWNTTGGTGELAKTGPGRSAKLDEPSDALAVTNITFIRPLTKAAEAAWYR